MPLGGTTLHGEEQAKPRSQAEQHHIATCQQHSGLRAAPSTASQQVQVRLEEACAKFWMISVSVSSV